MRHPVEASLSKVELIHYMDQHPIAPPPNFRLARLEYNVPSLKSAAKGGHGHHGARPRKKTELLAAVAPLTSALGELQPYYKE